MQRIKLLAVLIAILPLSRCGPNENRIQIKEIDGIKHILNSENPLKGTVALDVEKIREIDPYTHEEVALNRINFTRNSTGEVILFDAGSCEAHRFGADDEYLGNFISIGQGPGEFQKYHGMRAYYTRGGICVFSSIKMAWFSASGGFLRERKLRNHPEELIDDSRFLTEESEWLENGRRVRIVLVELLENGGEHMGPVFHQSMNTGMFYDMEKRRGFSDIWATPYALFTFNPSLQRIAVAMNTEYKIHMKDLNAKTDFVIERSYSPYKLSTDQKKELVRWDENDEISRWKLSVYPDTHVALRNIKILPGGYLAVSHFTDFKKTEIDVFDREGRYIYLWKLEEEIPLDDAQFFPFGFSTVETQDEMPVYVEYRIKNLPEIFR